MMILMDLEVVEAVAVEMEIACLVEMEFLVEVVVTLEHS